MNCSKATEFHRKSGQGLGLNSEYDLSAVGAALTLGPLAPVSLGEVVTFLHCFTVNEGWVPHSSPVSA